MLKCSFLDVRSVWINYEVLHETDFQDMKNFIRLLDCPDAFHSQGHTSWSSINGNSRFCGSMWNDSLKNYKAVKKLSTSLWSVYRMVDFIQAIRVQFFVAGASSVSFLIYVNDISHQVSSDLLLFTDVKLWRDMQPRGWTGTSGESNSTSNLGR